MKRGQTGKLIPQSVLGRDYEAFTPNGLPPTPPIEWTTELIKLLTDATACVGRLDGAARLLPDLDLFIYSYIRKEAVLSSQIEGTQSSLSDLMMFENEMVPGVPIDDVTEVVRYVNAITEGVRRIREGESISLNLILDLHKILLSTGRGADKDPGMIRVHQNWIGGASPDRAGFVPPTPAAVEALLVDLINYWTTSEDPTLVKAAIMHVQFETIHPFRDGNGRIGRLLITLILCQAKLITEPLVYLSLFFKENRQDYYDKLQSIRTSGDWEDWLHFFLQGTIEVTDSAFKLTEKIQQLFAADLKLIRKRGGRKAPGMEALYRASQESPVLSIPKAEKILHQSISRPTLYSAASELVALDILQPIKNEKSDTQAYAYQAYIKLLR